MRGMGELTLLDAIAVFEADQCAQDLEGVEGRLHGREWKQGLLGGVAEAGAWHEFDQLEGSKACWRDIGYFRVCCRAGKCTSFARSFGVR